jgi:hypothetical protein
MKQVVERCREREMIFRSLKPIEPKRLGSRKRIQIFLGVDMKKYYHVVIFIEKKSRILRKEAEELMGFHHKVEQLIESKIKYKCILIHAPLCSKAKQLLEENGWKVEILG